MSATLKGNAIHRFYQFHRDLARRFTAAKGKNILEHPGVEKEGGTDVEGEAVSLDGAGPAADARLFLIDQ